MADRARYQPIGFKAAKARLLHALKTGDVQHEAREVLAEKNLLAIQAVTPEYVSARVMECTGLQYRSSPHHIDPATEVHTFFPGRGRPAREQWYIKMYFRHGAVFISVHKGSQELHE